MFSCDIDKIDYSTIIGKGAFGYVYPYLSKSKDQEWVVKVMKTPDFEKFLIFIEEIVLGFSCQHESILPMKGYSIKKEHTGYTAFLRLPRMMGNLRQVLESLEIQNLQLSEADIVRCFYALASGLEYLHGKSISHRDIKPENILIDSEGKLQIADIGGAVFIADDETSKQSRNNAFGTLVYLPDEAINRRDQLKNKDYYKIDSWALGAVIGELCTTKRLLSFHIHKDQERQSYFASITEKGYSQDLLECIQGLLEVDIKTRLSIQNVKEILENKFGHILNNKPEEIQSHKTIVNLLQKKQTFVSEASRTLKTGSMLKASEIEEKKTPHMEVIQEKTSLKPNLDLENLISLKKSLEDQFKSKFELEVVDVLTLKAVSEEILENKNIQEFMMKLQDKVTESGLKHLKEFSLNLNGCDYLSNFQVLEMLSPIPLIFPQLQTLKLDLGDCSSLTNQGLQTIGNEFQHKYSLKKLSLNLSNCDELTDVGVKNFISSFQAKYKQLEKLEFNFEGCKHIKERGFDAMSEFGPENKSLKYLSLNLSNCEEIRDESAKSLIENIFEKLYLIEYLFLDFSLCSELTDETILALAESITHSAKKKPIKIKELCLSFSNCSEISNKGVEKLAGVLAQYFEQLTRIGLDFRDCHINDEEGFIKLIRSIGGHMTNLNHLQLGFSKDAVGSEGLEILAQEIQLRLKDLETLLLNLSSCDGINEQSFISFVGNLRENSQSLKTLDLNFAFCKSISNEGIGVLADALCDHFPNLETLKLCFLYCDTITVKSIESLLTKIEARNTPLKKINIIFGRKKAIEQLEAIKLRLCKNPNYSIG